MRYKMDPGCVKSICVHSTRVKHIADFQQVRRRGSLFTKRQDAALSVVFIYKWKRVEGSQYVRPHAERTTTLATVHERAKDDMEHRLTIKVHRDMNNIRTTRWRRNIPNSFLDNVFPEMAQKSSNLD